MSGEFMKYLPITLIAVLSASLVMALLFVPTLGSIFGKTGASTAEARRNLAAAETGDLDTVTGFLPAVTSGFCAARCNAPGSVLPA